MELVPAFIDATIPWHESTDLLTTLLNALGQVSTYQAQGSLLQVRGNFLRYKKDIGFFERTGDMVFALERQTVGKKVKQVPVIRRKN